MTLAEQMAELVSQLRARQAREREAMPQTPRATPSQPQPTLEAYRHALAAHDWHWAYSDNYTEWSNGKEARSKLLSMRRVLDPEGTIWAEYAPRITH